MNESIAVITWLLIKSNDVDQNKGASLHEIIEQVNKTMIKIYLVGGAVRDELLGLSVKEKDWLVVGATPEAMLKQGYQAVGKDFPVFLHPETKEEYALARTERKTAPGYQGFTFHADPNVTLEQDLIRRDLTINAMVRDQQGELIDPVGGQVDLEQRYLRHVSEAFAEDPVRILRVARFLARFYVLGFRVAESTMCLMQSMVRSGETQHLVAERVWQECEKALAEKNPECFLEVLQATGALADILPEFNSEAVEQAIKNMVDVAQESTSPLLRFSAMIFPLELASIKQIGERLAVPNQYRELAMLIKQYAADIIIADQLEAEHVIHIIQRTDAHRKKERFECLLEGVKLLSEQHNFDKVLCFWHRAQAAYLAVDPQVFIRQGLVKSDLGQAIAQQRLENIQALIHPNTEEREND